MNYNARGHPELKDEREKEREVKQTNKQNPNTAEAERFGYFEISNMRTVMAWVGRDLKALPLPTTGRNATH